MQNLDSSSSPAGAAQPPDADALNLQMITQQMRDNQNLSLAVLGGAGAAVVGAVIWAVITAVTHYQLGIMAIGVGFLVGFAVRILGRGITPTFGVIGAVLSLVGCAIGNFLASAAFYAEQEKISVFDVLKAVDFQTALDVMVQTFDPVDAVFYAIAVYYGYKNSFKTPAVADLDSTAAR